MLRTHFVRTAIHAATLLAAAAVMQAAESQPQQITLPTYKLLTVDVVGKGFFTTHTPGNKPLRVDYDNTSTRFLTPAGDPTSPGLVRVGMVIDATGKLTSPAALKAATVIVGVTPLTAAPPAGASAAPPATDAAPPAAGAAPIPSGAGGSAAPPAAPGVAPKTTLIYRVTTVGTGDFKVSDPSGAIWSVHSDASTKWIDGSGKATTKAALITVGRHLVMPVTGAQGTLNVVGKVVQEPAF